MSLSSSAAGRQGGFTLVELTVTLAILSILAAVTVPFAETMVRRQQEVELRRGLRDIRQAIDAFHDDWKRGKVPSASGLASVQGYPRELKVLVEGVPRPGTAEGRRRYLRRVPRNPFADASLPAEEGWALRSYLDQARPLSWGGEDVYDVFVRRQDTALDGSRYEDW